MRCYRESDNEKLTNPGFPAAHREPAYRCFLPDLTGFTGPWLRRTRACERVFISDFELQISDFWFPFRNPHSAISN